MFNLRIKDKLQSDIEISAKLITYGSYSIVFSFTWDCQEYILKVNHDWDLNELGIMCGIRHPNLLSAEWFFFDNVHKQLQQINSPDLSSVELIPYMTQMCIISKKHTPLNLIKLNNLNIISKATLIADIITGVKHLHDRGIYHGDIKPHNIFINKNIRGEYNRAILGDFSLTYPLEVDTSINGSIGYSSPETTPDIEEESTPYLSGIVSDVWSLGCVILYILTEHEPFLKDKLFTNLSEYQECRDHTSVFLLDKLQHCENFDFWFKILRVMLEYSSSKRYINLDTILKGISKKYKITTYNSVGSPRISNIEYIPKLGEYFKNILGDFTRDREDLKCVISDKYKDYFPKEVRMYETTKKKLYKIIETSIWILQKHSTCQESTVLELACCIFGLNSQYSPEVVEMIYKLKGKIWI